MFDIEVLALYCMWNNVILLPKGRCEYIIIGFLGVILKVISIIIYRCLVEYIELYDVLHMFRVWRGTRTATLDVRIFQGITGMRKEVMYDIFVDIYKYNDSLEQGGTLEILED